MSNGHDFTRGTDRFHTQELRIALVMNGGVSLAVWIGGVTHEINRLVRGESIYFKLCDALALKPRVDVIAGTSAGGINGGLLALALTQDTSLDPLRNIWLEKGDMLTLLRTPTGEDPPSLLDGGYFYRAMVQSFGVIANQTGKSFQSADRVPIDLTLTTTVLQGEVRDFPDDLGTVIRDVTHRGRMEFKRGPDISGDPFADADIVRKLATAARATASFPGAFEPFFLPGPENKGITAGGEPVADLTGHANFRLDRFVVDGGVLDNNPLEAAIDAVFRQRAERHVRRVLAYVVPDPGQVPDSVPQRADAFPTMAQTVLASLVSIPRVESISDQLRAIAEHNRSITGKRDTRVVIAQILGWQSAEVIAQQSFDGYRKFRALSAAEHIAAALASGAARCVDAQGQPIAIGWRRREQLASQLAQLDPAPWIPSELSFNYARGWDWGLFTLENVTLVLMDLLRRAARLAPVRRSELSTELWDSLRISRRKTYDLVAELGHLRRLDRRHWENRGTARCRDLLAGFDLASEGPLRGIIQDELQLWIAMFESVTPPAEPARAADTLHPPFAFTDFAERVGRIFLESAPLLRAILARPPSERDRGRHEELTALTEFLLPGDQPDIATLRQRLLTLEVVQYTFGGEHLQDQHLELVQISANTPTAFGGPSRLEEKLAGVQIAHFGAFYKRSWRINDWMFGRLDGAERLMRIVLDPSRLVRLFGWEPGDTRNPDEAVATVLELVRGVAFDDVRREDDRELLEGEWRARLATMRDELAYLADPARPIPEQLPECASLLVARLHLDILRQEMPQLADAVGDDGLDGADANGNGPKFLRRFERALGIPAAENAAGLRQKSPAVAGQLSAEQLVELFREAKVGEEKVQQEFGSDRFTVMAARATAVASTALAGKHSGLKLLRGVFAATRLPLITLDIIVSGLLKRGRAMVGLYAMIMAAAFTIVISPFLAGAEWPGLVIAAALITLAAGFIVFLRRHGKLMLFALLILAALWVWLLVIPKE